MTALLLVLGFGCTARSNGRADPRRPPHHRETLGNAAGVRQCPPTEHGSIFWWVVKLGMAVALAGGGILLNLTGFDVEQAGAQSADTITMMRAFDAFIPAITSAVAIWAVWSYPITEETAREVREQLEARRGSAGAA